MSNLLSRWSKSTDNLKEKKKTWNIINVKTKRKSKVSKILISTPLDYKHTAGVNPSDGRCFSEDQSAVPSAKTAEIITRKKLSKGSSNADLFDDIQINLGSMNILDEVMSIMDKECPRRNLIREYDLKHHNIANKTENDNLDRNSLGNTTDYTSDTESRGTGVYSTTSVDESEKSERRNTKLDGSSQKDSFYSTTDVSQCETDREVQL